VATEREGERENPLPVGERENPLPDGAWVELTTQLDDADDERGRFLAARRRPYDAVETEIAPVRPAFPSSPSEAFTDHLDREYRTDRARAFATAVDALLTTPPRPQTPALTLAAALRRLHDERRADYLAVVLCYVDDRRERAVAEDLGVTQPLIHRRKKRGAAQLAVWTGRPLGEIEATLAALGRASTGSTGTGEESVGE